MRSRWNDADAASHEGPLGACVYASRLIGSDPSLVVQGGGNTSVKLRETDLHGDPVDVLYVKASGWELADIEPAGFSPLDLGRVRRLAELPELADTTMVNELIGARREVAAPSPSVEAILHAVIPDAAVLHAHPDALLAISNTDDGEARIRDLYGDRVVVVPYAMPGFRAARATADAHRCQASDTTEGIVLLHHGIVTFGESPRQAYQRLIDLVDLAETYLAERSASGGSPTPADPPPSVDRAVLADLRASISDTAGRPCILRRHREPAMWAFARRPDVAAVSQRGVATPDHVIWTKRVPMIGRDVARYAADYREYFDEHADGRPLRMLDPAPRVVLDPDLGVLTAGPDVHAEQAASDVYRQTIGVIERSEGLGGYAALPPRDVFDLEYWELEQAKLDRVADQGEFTGEIAVVTGANSGIGRGCARALLARGAAVVGLDLNAAVAEMSDHPAYLGIGCDVSSLDDLTAALDRGVERFGGVDMLVAAAGVFPESAPIFAHDAAAWSRAMRVNVDGLVQLMALVHPMLVRAPRGGRVVVIGSKNVRAPGPGASAYSASKAAANQIARVAALEWAPDRIRVNSVHPDAVFDTALWTPELLAERAKRYGLTIDEYKRRNLLGVEITSADVGGIVAALLGDGFGTVTGAHIPIDGGNERVI